MALLFGVRPMIRRIFASSELAVGAVPALAGPGGLIVGPSGATVSSAPGAAALPGHAGVNVTSLPGGSITSAGGPNVNIVGSDASVAISNRTSAMIDIAQVQGQVHAQSVQKVGELADKNPRETISIIRQWLTETAAA
jgi:flagellar M-ring protein FliF